MLVDAGALVALLDADDAEHERAVGALKGISDPLASVWPALAEAMHLVAETRDGQASLCDMVSDGHLELLDLPRPTAARIKTLLHKYRDVPMDFADAALVCAAERERITRIVSFDRHFLIYRLANRSPFTVLPGPRARR